MTNKEKYKRTFDTLASSERFSLEVTEMKKENKTKHVYNRIAAAAAALVLVLSASTAAYASDLGGIKTMFTMWINGEQQNATVTSTSNDYDYEFTYKDADGKDVTVGGGGVTTDENGNERPMTASEIAESFGDTAVDRDDNGKVYLTYKNLKFDITSAVNAGKTKFVFTADGKEHYVTIDDTANEGTGSYSLSDCVGPNDDASDYEVLN